MFSKNKYHSERVHLKNAYDLFKGIFSVAIIQTITFPQSQIKVSNFAELAKIFKFKKPDQMYGNIYPDHKMITIDVCELYMYPHALEATHIQKYKISVPVLKFHAWVARTTSPSGSFTVPVSYIFSVLLGMCMYTRK